jgi:Gas vesicle protein K
MKSPKPPARRRASPGRNAKKAAAAPRRARPRQPGQPAADAPRSPLAGVDVQEIESLRAELARLGGARPPRWNSDPDDVRRSVAKLVLTLVEFIRQLLERQAIRRMEADTLTPEETEAVGLALMRLEETVRDLGKQFGLAPEDLNLDLGPVGKLM